MHRVQQPVVGRRAPGGVAHRLGEQPIEIIHRRAPLPRSASPASGPVPGSPGTDGGLPQPRCAAISRPADRSRTAARAPPAGRVAARPAAATSGRGPAPTAGVRRPAGSGTSARTASLAARRRRQDTNCRTIAVRTYASACCIVVTRSQRRCIRARTSCTMSSARYASPDRTYAKRSSACPGPARSRRRSCAGSTGLEHVRIRAGGGDVDVALHDRERTAVGPAGLVVAGAGVLDHDHVGAIGSGVVLALAVVGALLGDGEVEADLAGVRGAQLGRVLLADGEALAVRVGGQRAGVGDGLRLGQQALPSGCRRRGCPAPGP